MKPWELFLYGYALGLFFALVMWGVYTINTGW